jgi:hypothetical protein
MESIGCIALVEWTWKGHHPIYFNQFILALEELGYDVLAVCPDPKVAEAAADATRQISNATISNRGRSQFVKFQNPALGFNRLRAARINAIELNIRRHISVEHQVRKWTKKSGRKVDAIFYACMYDWDFECTHLAQPFLRIPWTGLYLHAMSYRMPGRPHPLTGRVPCPKKMFSGRLCKGIAILDEGIAERVSISIGKPVVVFPDLSDERLATSVRERVLGERLKRFADGRPIVGLFGHLHGSKGILTFLETAQMPAASEICFALGGEMAWNNDEGANSQIQVALAECPNLWSHLARIPDGPCLNGVMTACDVIFAAYWDFPHSSNIMTKAAVLKKVLIVSDGYLMAERLRRFNLGEIIPQANAGALLDAILKITQDPEGWVANNKPQWESYCHEHSFERLKVGLRGLLAPLRA